VTLTSAPSAKDRLAITKPAGEREKKKADEKKSRLDEMQGEKTASKKKKKEKSPRRRKEKEYRSHFPVWGEKLSGW